MKQENNQKRTEQGAKQRRKQQKNKGKNKEKQDYGRRGCTQALHVTPYPPLFNVSVITITVYLRGYAPSFQGRVNSVELKC